MANRNKKSVKRKPRTKMLGVLVNSDEDRLFRQLAERRHASLAQVIRDLLYREAEMEKARKFQAA